MKKHQKIGEKRRYFFARKTGKNLCFSRFLPYYYIIKEELCQGVIEKV